MLTSTQQIRHDIENARTKFNNLMAQAGEFLDEYAGLINIWATPVTTVYETYVTLDWSHGEDFIELGFDNDVISIYLFLDDEYQILEFNKDTFVTNMHKMFGGSTA